MEDAAQCRWSPFFNPRLGHARDHGHTSNGKIVDVVVPERLGPTQKKTRKKCAQLYDDELNGSMSVVGKAQSGKRPSDA